MLNNNYPIVHNMFPNKGLGATFSDLKFRLQLPTKIPPIVIMHSPT